MSEFNWSEHIANVQNDRARDEVMRGEAQRQQDERRAVEQLTLQRMDAAVRCFLWAAGTQGWPGVIHEFDSVTIPQGYRRQKTEQRYVGARYISQHYAERRNYVSARPPGISVNVNGDWSWVEEELSTGNVDTVLQLTCNNNAGVLSNRNGTHYIKLHPEETPQKVMSVLAQIAVDNAIIL